MKINISINEVKTTNQKQYSLKVKTHRNRNRKELLKNDTEHIQKIYNTHYA